MHHYRNLKKRFRREQNPARKRALLERLLAAEAFAQFQAAPCGRR